MLKPYYSHKEVSAVGTSTLSLSRYLITVEWGTKEEDDSDLAVKITNLFAEVINDYKILFKTETRSRLDYN